MKTIHEESRRYWKNRTDARHRYAGEDWFERYAGELIALVPAGGTLLDVGCGACDYTPYLATKFDRVIGIDFSPAMLEAAHVRVAQFQLSNVTLLEGDAISFPAEVERADAILVNGLLQYLDDKALQKHLAECTRVLAPGGIICWGSVPNLHLRWLWYVGALSTPPPPLRQMIKQWWQVVQSQRRAERSGDALWDNIGRWFEPAKLKAKAEAAGYMCEFRNSWFSEYRFHAILRRASAG